MIRSVKNIAAIVLLSIVVGIVFFIRCYNRELSGDELLYEYVWEEDDPTDLWNHSHRYERKISSWSDVWQSQVKHYFIVNGRAPVHIAEQAFTGHLLLFSVLNTFVFFIFITLIIYYVAPKEKRCNYLLWLSVIMIITLFFPMKYQLWTSINYALNYLWPATMAMGVLILWDKIEQCSLAKKYTAPVVILTLIFGWSHELFVVPIAGSMFFYYCWHRKAFRGQILALVLPLWTTALLLVFSPGNMVRYFGKAESVSHAFIDKILNGVNLLAGSWIFLVLIVLVILLLATGVRRKLVEFFKKNIKLVMALGISVLFTMIANSYEQSVTFMELASLLLILKYICGLQWQRSKLAIALSLVLTVCFAAQQSIVAKDTIENYKYQHRLVEEYKNSPDGLIHYNDSFIHSIALPYVKVWREPSFIRTMSLVYSGFKKPMILLFDADYQAVTRPESFFMEKNRFPGTAPFYYGSGGFYYWAKPNALRSGKSFVAELYPVDWTHKNLTIVGRLWILLFPEKYSNRMKLDVDTIDSPRYGRLLKVKIPESRKVKAINVE